MRIILVGDLTHTTRLSQASKFSDDIFTYAVAEPNFLEIENTAEKRLLSKITFSIRISFGQALNLCQEFTSFR